MRILAAFLAFLAATALAAAGESAPAAANLVKNGDFSAGKDSPDGWSKMDNLSTFWVPGGADVEKAATDGKKLDGKCLKVDTDVYLKEWEEQRKSMEVGKPGDPKTKTPTKGDKYDTVAGTKGVAVYSDEIEVKPETGYKLSIAAKSSVKSTDLFFPKIFVKGYADVNGEMREVYNMYLACRITETGKWTAFEREFHPTKRTPAVKKMKVMIYAYWPPGVYHFDDLKIAEAKEEAK
jgi:hypothetical protein